MTATSYSGPIDATDDSALAIAAAALSSYVAAYGSYNTSDYPTWQAVLSTNVSAGNSICVISVHDNVYFIEYDSSIASLTCVVYGTNVILIETSA